MGVLLDPHPDVHPGNRSLTRGLLIATVLSCFFSIAAMHILMGLAFLSWVSSSLPAARGPYRVPFMWWIIGFVALSLASALNARNAHSLKEVFSMTMPFIFYIMVRDSMAGPRYLHRSARYLVLGGVTLAGLVLGGLLEDDVTNAGLTAIAFAVALGQAIFLPNSLKRYLYGAASVALLITAGPEDTPGLWLGIIVAMASLGALAGPRGIGIAVLAIAGLLLLSPEQVHQNLLGHAEAEGERSKPSVQTWQEGMEVVLDRPLLGAGPKLVGLLTTEGAEPAEVPSSFRNNAVQLAAERGLPAALLWIGIWVAWFIRVVKLHRSLDPTQHGVQALSASCLAAIACFHTMGLYTFNMGDSEVAFLALFVFALPLALETALDRSQSS